MSKNYSSIFVFSDIHGCAAELKLLLNKLPLKSDSLIVLMGDYIDRGPNSKEVIDTILDLKKMYNVVALKGNHEAMFLKFLEDPASADAGLFVYNGGGSTLASYRQDESDKYVVPREHLEFFTELETYYETDDYFFVHAGVPDRSLKDLDDECEEDLLWIRDDFFYSSFDWKKMIVHGHTPVGEVEISENRINIDTGCVFNNKLSAIELPDRKVYSVTKKKKLFHVYLKDDRQSSTRQSIRFTGSIPVYVYQDETMLKFETINYSEHGILMKDLILKNKMVFTENQLIKGVIGDSSYETIRFEGSIVRADKGPQGVFYAIKFIKTPFSLTENPLENK